MNERKNTHRFSGHQAVSDMVILLHRLGTTCLDHMEHLLLGTDYKHGELFKDSQDGQAERIALLDAAIDLLQELEITQEDIAASWDRVKQERQDGFQWGKEWVEKYGP